MSPMLLLGGAAASATNKRGNRSTATALPPAMLRVASSLRHLQRASVVRQRIPGAIVGCKLEDRREHKDTLPLIVIARTNETSLLVGQYRLFSSASDQVSSVSDQGTDTNTEADSSSSFEDTLNKLFGDQDNSSAVVDAASATASTVQQTALPWDPHWYNLADQAINVINFFHAQTDLNYALSIFGVTCIARVFLFPIFVKGQKTQSRMAHMQPELAAVKARIDAAGPNIDRDTQVKYGMQMKALFKKYDCNPMNALIVPAVQTPFFMSMFFGLRKMPDYFPEELSTGGIWWFKDLTATDPYFILPALSALSFYIMIENGKEQMIASSPAQGPVMVNIFRGMSIIMFPVACGFSTAVLCYWVTNNSITLMQSVAFQNPTVRKRLGIWDPPKPVPGAGQPKGFVESIQDAAGKMQGTVQTEEQKMQAHNDAIENKKKAAKRSKAARVRRDGRFIRAKRKKRVSRTSY